MSNEKKQLLCQCFHCGNEGLLNIVGENIVDFGGSVYDPYGNEIDCELPERFKWEILSCPVCSMPTLHETYSSAADADSTGDWVPTRSILYPENKISTAGFPPLIKSAFESVIKIKKIDTALCVMALRRVLEQICLDKKASGKNLEAMIKDLIDQNILPNGFDGACKVIRLLGNKAAHGSESTFYKHEVEELISLLKAIIEYLYVIPEKIGKLQRRIERKVPVIKGK